jgi:tetratricopeptide (TPR) repeat protein
MERLHPVNRYLLLIAILFSLILAGCGDDEEFDAEAAQKRLAEGWAAYNQSNFPDALLGFERAVNLDPTLAEAYNGLGWSHLSASRSASINPQVLAKAQSAFEEAIRLDSANADAWVGLANTLFLRRENAADFRTALRAIDNAFQSDHRTLFRHDYHSAADLHALKAACYYYLNETSLASAAVDAALSADAQNATANALKVLLK